MARRRPSSDRGLRHLPCGSAVARSIPTAFLASPWHPATHLGALIILGKRSSLSRLPAAVVLACSLSFSRLLVSLQGRLPATLSLYLVVQRGAGLSSRLPATRSALRLSFSRRVSLPGHLPVALQLSTSLSASRGVFRVVFPATSALGSSPATKGPSSSSSSRRSATQTSSTISYLKWCYRPTGICVESSAYGYPTVYPVPRGVRVTLAPFGMGSRLSYPSSCTVHYPWDVGLLLSICDWIPGYLLLLLLGVGATTCSRVALKALCAHVPRSYRLASNVASRWSRRLSRTRHSWWFAAPRPRSPRLRDPPASPSPRAARSPAISPRRVPLQPPSSLALLAPLPNPPAGLVRALEGYQLKPFDDSQ